MNNSERQLVWRDQVWPGYRVLRTGQIVGPRGVMRPSADKRGYPRISLGRPGEKQMTALVHQIVAETFIGPRPPGSEVAHGDGNKTNNASENLRYATCTQNHADMVLHGTAPRGSKNGRAKLTESDVEQIRAHLSAGAKQRDIAADFGVAPSTIAMIATNRNWCVK